MKNELTCTLILGILLLGCGAAVPDGEAGSGGSTQPPLGGTSEGGSDASTRASSTTPGDSTTDAGPGSSPSTSGGGVDHDTGSGSTTAMLDTSTTAIPDTSTTAVPDPAGVVPCGEEVCDVASEFCLGCSHPDGLDTHCLGRTSELLYDELGRDFRHGCTAGVSLFLECDDTADCGPGEVCRFVSGDFAFAVCELGDRNAFGTACDDETLCAVEAPTCGPHDPLGYFTPFARVLGWTPQACQP